MLLNVIIPPEGWFVELEIVGVALVDGIGACPTYFVHLLIIDLTAIGLVFIKEYAKLWILVNTNRCTLFVSYGA